MSFNGSMGEQTMVHPYSGIDKHDMDESQIHRAEKRHQIQNAAYCIILFI